MILFNKAVELRVVHQKPKLPWCSLARPAFLCDNLIKNVCRCSIQCLKVYLVDLFSDGTRFEISDPEVSIIIKEEILELQLILGNK